MPARWHLYLRTRHNSPRICELLRQLRHFPLASRPRTVDLRDLSDSAAIKLHPWTVASNSSTLAARCAKSLFLASYLRQQRESSRDNTTSFCMDGSRL